MLDTVSRLWSPYPQLFKRPSVQFDILVSAQPAINTEPRYANQGHLFSIIASQKSFAMADLQAGFAFASVPDCLATGELRYYYLEPIVYLLIAARQFALVHASCVSLGGRAVLLCGDSGAGKTCLAFACAKKGWTFISGDAAAVVREESGCRVIGRPYEIRFRQSARDLFPELLAHPPVMRANGKIDVEASPQHFGLASALEARISHVVFLERSLRVNATFGYYSKDEARRRLELAVCFGDEANRHKQKVALAKLLHLPVLGLSYSDLDGAECALRSLVEMG